MQWIYRKVENNPKMFFWVTLITFPILMGAAVMGWVLFVNEEDAHYESRYQESRCSNARSQAERAKSKAEYDVRNLQEEILYETGHVSKRVPPCQERCVIANMAKSECSSLGGRLPDNHTAGICRLDKDEDGCRGIGGEWYRGEYPDC